LIAVMFALPIVALTGPQYSVTVPGLARWTLIDPEAELWVTPLCSIDANRLAVSPTPSLRTQPALTDAAVGQKTEYLAKAM
jgi:hypothetical protein